MEINITTVVNNYIKYISLNWEMFNQHLENLKFKDNWQKKDSLDTWLQFCWEIYVELVVCKAGEFLTQYGDGAECSISGRVTYANSEPTHTIKCKKNIDKTTALDYLSNNHIDIENKEFYKFISYNGKFHHESTPFDYILLLDDLGEYYLIKNENIFFVKIPNCR